jgi:NTP pyrophosphatase (non-canonical NTP hydrolase)
MYYAQLSPAELERLAKLAEECAEVIQVVGKIMVHGYASGHPNRPEQGNNRQHLEEELGHVEYLTQLMCSRGDVNADKIWESHQEKSETIGKYLHHQEGL